MSSCDDIQRKLTERANALVSTLSKESTALAADIKERARGINPDIDTSGPDMWIGADFDITWDRVDFSLDLPEITMVNQRWSLDLPQVTMKNQELIFNTPSVRMKTVKTGEYPETTCRMVTKDVGLGVKLDLPECTVRWSPIYIDVPEPFWEEQRIVMGIPEFRMDRTEFIIGIPEFTMKTQKFALHLPQFTLKNINIEANKAKEKGDLLSNEAKTRGTKLRETFKENAKVELGGDVTALFDCYQSELMQRKNDAMKRFDDGVNVIQSTITAMVSNKIQDDNESLIKLKQGLAELVAKREEFANSIQAKFVALGDQQKNFFDKLIGGT